MRGYLGLLVVIGLAAALAAAMADAGAQDTISGLLREGALLYQKGKFDEASAKFSRAAKLEPRNADAHAWLGRTYLQKALVEFKTVARLAPNTDNGAVARKWIERIQGSGSSGQGSSSSGSGMRPATPQPRVTNLADLRPVLNEHLIDRSAERLFGDVYSSALRLRGYNSESCVSYSIKGAYDRFQALVGIPDNNYKSSIAMVKGDLHELARTAPLRSGEPPTPITASVKGVQRLDLCGISADRSSPLIVWANAKLIKE